MTSSPNDACNHMLPHAERICSNRNIRKKEPNKDQKSLTPLRGRKEELKVRQPLPRATPCLSRNNPPMESRRAQPKRAAQDAYAQSRAVSQEPLMLEPGARAISKKHRPADMLAPPGSQALLPSDNGGALGREPLRCHLVRELVSQEGPACLLADASC